MNELIDINIIYFIFIQNPITLSELIMIKKTFFLSLLGLIAFLLFAQTPQAEARGHCRSSTSLHVNVGTAYNNNCVTRRYVRPVVVPTTVYAQPCYYNPYAPVYTYQAPVYVEEVYAAPAPVHPSLHRTWIWRLIFFLEFL